MLLFIFDNAVFGISLTFALCLCLQQRFFARKLVVAQRRCVLGNFAVKHADNTVGIFFCKVGVVRNHNDELCFGYFFEQLHYGNTRFAVEGARRFVGKNNSGIVYDCAGNGNALHLSARQLIGFLLSFSFKPTRISASLARFLLSALGTPPNVMESSTFSKIVRWGMRL